MAGLTFEEKAKDRPRQMPTRSQPQSPSSAVDIPSSLQLLNRYIEIPPPWSLTDPLVQDLNLASRKYLFYCEAT